MQEQLGALSGLVQEYLTAIGVVRAYTMEARAQRHFAEANAEFLRRSLALARTQSQFTPLTGLIGGVGALVVLWVGGTAVADGRLSLGALVAFNGYLAYLAWPTMALGWTWSIVRRGLTSMGRILDITVPAPAVPEDGHPLPGPLGLRFTRLTFAYDGREPALCDVSFSGGAGGEGGGRRRHGKRQVHPRASGGAAVGAAARHGVRERAGRARHSPRPTCAGPSATCPRRAFSSRGRSSTT